MLPGRYLNKLPPDPLGAFLLGVWVGASGAIFLICIRDVLEIVAQ